MENASKALIIAGEIFLAIILLTLFSYIFSLMSENTARIEKKEKLNQITQFNQEFLNYEGRGTKAKLDSEGHEMLDSNGKKIYINPLTTEDVATLINLVADYNKRFNTNIIITLGRNPNVTGSYTNGNDWLERKKSDSDPTVFYRLYKCESVEIDNKTQLVKKINLNRILL